MAELDIVQDTGGDWEALYVNGQCMEQNHSINWVKCLKDLKGAGLDEVTIHEVDCEKYGQLPLAFEDIEKEDLG
jgi:hypothetical protein